MKKNIVLLLAMPIIMSSCSSSSSFNKIAESKYSSGSTYDEFAETYRSTSNFKDNLVKNKNFYTLKYINNSNNVTQFKSGNKSLGFQSEVSCSEINSEVDVNNRNLKFSKKRTKEQKTSTPKYELTENTIYDNTYYFQYVQPGEIGTLFYNIFPKTKTYAESTYAATDPLDALLIKASDSNIISNYFRDYSESTDKENYSFYLDGNVSTAKYALTKTEEVKDGDEVAGNKVTETLNIEQISVTNNKMSMLYNTYSKTTTTYTKDYVESGIFLSAGDVFETISESSKYYEINLKDNISVERIDITDYTLVK